MRDTVQNIVLAIVAALCGGILYRQFTLPVFDPASVLDAPQYTMRQAFAAGATGLDHELLGDDDEHVEAQPAPAADEPDPRLWESTPDLLY